MKYEEFIMKNIYIGTSSEELNYKGYLIPELREMREITGREQIFIKENRSRVGIRQSLCNCETMRRLTLCTSYVVSDTEIFAFET